MTTAINLTLMQIPKRAESVDRETLMNTFVDVGPLVALLNTPDHQILFGRRGTGKTHVLAYMAEQIVESGDWAIYIDLRQIGSSHGLYADADALVTERGTRLLLDLLGVVQSELTDRVLQDAEDESVDFSAAMDILDQLADEVSRVQVVGQVVAELTTSEASQTGSQTAVGISPQAIEASLSSTTGSTSASEQTIRRSGTERHHVSFGSVTSMLQQFVAALPDRRIWILVDEWSAIPIDLQPLLADLLRRSLFPVRGLTVKIAAVEHRSRFLLRGGDQGYVGIELGADASANADLDDFLVFKNEADRAQTFFRELLYRHVVAVVSTSRLSGPAPPIDSREFIRTAFTREDTFDELVRSAEGVPRDAINVAALAAQLADDSRISMPNVREAARRWYQRDKASAVTVDSEAEHLLHWIIDVVISEKRTKGFLLDPRGINDPNIQDLYDARVLHLIRREISSRDRPGVRFNAYALDFGCYVHLTTARAPLRLFDAETDEGPEEVEVPGDDYRSIRKAVLDLAAYYASR